MRSHPQSSDCLTSIYEPRPSVNDQTGPMPKSVPVAKNDDRGPADFTAQLALSLPQDGLYYIGVTTSDRGEQGQYQLQAEGI